MSNNCQEDGDPSASSALSEFSDEDEAEIQRHHLDTDDHISIESSPVITRRRISTIEYIITPKKLKYHEDEFLSLKPTEIVDEVFVSVCKTPERSSEEIKMPLPKCPVKLHYGKWAKSEKACKKLPIPHNYPAVPDSGLSEDAKILVVKKDESENIVNCLSQENNEGESFDDSKCELKLRKGQNELSLQSSQSSAKDICLVVKNKKEQNKESSQSSQFTEESVICLYDGNKGMKTESSTSCALTEVEDVSLQEQRKKKNNEVSLNSQAAETKDSFSTRSSWTEQSKEPSQSWSQVSDRKDSSKDVNKDLIVAYQNTIRIPVTETLHRTPKGGYLELSNFVLNRSDKKCENITLSDASPVFWGSSISGISPLSQSSTEISNKCVPFNAESPKEENCTNKSIKVYTSTPLSSKIDLEFEDCKEISSVTEGLTDGSSVLLVQKTSRVVNSSELQFSESQESNGSDCDKGSGYVNSSQELSESDKENVDPNSKELPRVKRIRVETGLDCDCVDYHSNSRSCVDSATDGYLESF